MQNLEKYRRAGNIYHARYNEWHRHTSELELVMLLLRKLLPYNH